MHLGKSKESASVAILLLCSAPAQHHIDDERGGGFASDVRVAFSCCVRVFSRAGAAGASAESICEASLKRLLWPGFSVPADCRLWLASVVAAVEFFPLAISISDFTAPGEQKGANFLS
eukprot:6178148-Pleurochrysis_carterae.AAC.5